MIDLLLLAQTAPVPGPDWQGWAQLGFAALIAVYMLMYAMPEAQKRYENSLKEMTKTFGDTLTAMSERFDKHLENERAEVKAMRDTFKCRAP